MKELLYTGAFRFPDGDAAATRVYAVSRLFVNAGYAVTFAGWESVEHVGGFYQYKGHACYAQDEFRKQKLRPIARLFGFLFRGSKTLIWLWRNCKYDVIVAYNPPAIFSLGLLLLGQLLDFKVVLDTTEWYEGEHLPGGRYGVAAIENSVRMHLVYLLFRHVICISRFLQEYFNGRNVINIPPLMVSDLNTVTKPALKEGVHFIYAGDAGKKDKLLPFIIALPKLFEDMQCPVILHVAGLQWENLSQLITAQGEVSEVYQPFVKCYGRVSRDRVAELYSQCHFSILFREDKRYAQAGFPTKAIESWGYGCPIVLNLVGDIGCLAKNMVDAIVVEETCIAQSVSATLKIIINTDIYPQMSLNSRKASKKFTVDEYNQSFSVFVRRLAI